MKKIVLYLFVFSWVNAPAAEGIYSAGARAAAMGNAALTSQDVWSLFHNPAGLAFLKNAEVAISYEKRFSLKELSTNGLAVAVPVGKTGTVGVNAIYFGYKNYYEQQAGLCYAKRFSNKVAAAVKLNYQSFNIGEEYGSRNVFTGEVGIQAMIIRNLWIGSHIYNPFQSLLADEPKEHLPSVFSFGAGYIFSEKMNIQASATKNSDLKSIFMTGIEYHPVKEFWLRAGMSTQPFSSSFGFGMELENLQLDFAAGFHPQLGFTPHISLGYHFIKKIKQ